jgi:hypothetical protein
VQQQQILGGIIARLAQLAKEPPDLLTYIRAHAECVAGAFRPAGFAYDFAHGATFQRILHGNSESLNLKGAPEQEHAFIRARSLAADQRKPVVLPPGSSQAGSARAPTATDSPAPEEIPIFNRTPFEQLFIPILSGDGVAGVLHIWFTPVAPSAAHTRVTLLRQLCGEIDHYLKARRARDAFQEVTRLTTYSRLLEELTGDIELDSISWKLVNYAREAVACERVCLFIPTNYGSVGDALDSSRKLHYQFRLQACSGLKKPHPKSEQAVTLQHVAQKLTEMSLAKTATEAAEPGATPVPIAAGAAVHTPQAGERELVINPDRQVKDALPKVHLTLMMRDPSKTATRPPEVNEYFEIMPMNWATVIPLFDREHRVCGILLFEGVKLEDKLSGAIKPMMELAASAGKALGTTLYCTQHRPMRVARRLIAMHDDYVNTPAKRKLLRFGVPILLVLGILLCPFPYSVKGSANVLPVTQTTMPALVNARLLSVDVREGQLVKQGQVLARFETTDLQLQLSQAEQEYSSSLVESDHALAIGNEAQMQIARLNADKAAAAAEKLRIDLARAVVRAPFDGLVLGAQTLSTRVGEVLRLGEPALQIVDPTTWQVKASLKERDLIFLGKELQAHGHVPAALRLAANPARKYELDLTNARQLAYGLDTTTGEYQFTVMLPLNEELADARFFKAGFTGRVTFDTGIRPLAYVLFKDFFDFLTVRFF